MQIPSDTHQGPPCPFRACGFTGDAGNYPKSLAALELTAEMLNVRVDQLPRGARNHPSPYTQKWMERLAQLRLDGAAYRHEGGRFLLWSEVQPKPAMSEHDVVQIMERVLDRFENTLRDLND